MHLSRMAPGIMNVKDNVNVSDWSLAKDFQNKSTGSRYPVHLTMSDRYSGFIAVLKFNKHHFEYECGSDQEYKFILSTPGDALKFSTNSHRIQLEKHTKIFITPKLTITSDALRKYTPSQRKCFFDGERRLCFFKIYSQPNCEAECLANFTRSACGCVQFSMPSIYCIHSVVDKTNTLFCIFDTI